MNTTILGDIDLDELVKACHKVKPEDLKEALSLREAIEDYLFEDKSLYNDLVDMLSKKFTVREYTTAYSQLMNIPLPEEFFNDVPEELKDTYDELADEIWHIAQNIVSFPVCFNDEDSIGLTQFPAMEMPRILNTERPTDNSIKLAPICEIPELLICMFADKQYTIKSLHKIKDKMLERFQEAQYKFERLREKIEALDIPKQ
jgi:hypothetical protein